MTVQSCLCLSKTLAVVSYNSSSGYSWKSNLLTSHSTKLPMCSNAAASRLHVYIDVLWNQHNPRYAVLLNQGLGRVAGFHPQSRLLEEFYITIPALCWSRQQPPPVMCLCVCLCVNLVCGKLWPCMRDSVRKYFEEKPGQNLFFSKL